MKIGDPDRKADKIELQMTPMIDIVFQLLIFFIMTFKIVAMEGDFSIKMPQASPDQGSPDEDVIPPLKLRLTSDANGNLVSVQLNDRDFNMPKRWERLTSHLLGMVTTDQPAGQDAEVELDCDYHLKYEHVIAAITAVSGYQDANKEVHTLIEKIKFSPPKEGPEG